MLKYVPQERSGERLRVSRPAVAAEQKSEFDKDTDVYNKGVLERRTREIWQVSCK